MSKILADFLGVNGAEFSDFIRKLEAQSGHPNIDVRLTAEIVGQARLKTSELGLDPDDTKPDELYHSLQLLVEKHDNFLSKIIKIKSIDSEINIQSVKKTVEELQLPTSYWALKDATAKKLLKILPPKKAMKILKFKSVDSMLKRAKIDSIFLAIKISESASWQDKFVKLLKDLNPSDFTKNKVKIVAVEDKQLEEACREFVLQAKHNIICIKELGIIAILPAPIDSIRGSSIAMVTMLVNAINDMRSTSTYLKIQQVKPNFGKIIASSINGNTISSVNLGGQKLPWKVIQQYLYRLDQANRHQIFGPHLDEEDIAWNKPEDILYKLEPALKFWESLDYVAFSTGEHSIPFNLSDNVISYCNFLKYGEHSTSYFKESLLNEIFIRYLLETSLGEEALETMEKNLIGSRVLEFDEVFA